MIANVIAKWMETSDQIRPEADPKAALSAYIAGKIDYSRLHPHASKVFASEILHGAPTIAERLSGDLKTWLDGKCAVIEGWIAAGKMAPVDPAASVLHPLGGDPDLCRFRRAGRSLAGPAASAPRRLCRPRGSW